MPRKLVLIVIDGLSPSALEAAIAADAAPTLAWLRSHDPGTAVSVFPSLTPVCLSAIATGAGPGEHRIPSLQWYHRGEGRFVEYGSSFGATVATGGTRQSIDDSMVNLNHLHLSPKLETVFESVEDAGLVAGAINFYVWRGRVRHPMRSRALGRLARRTGFFDATWGPTRLFFGDLFASDRTGAPRNIGVTGRNDDHAGAVGRWLVTRDGFDFLLFYLPETDAASHRAGPDGVTEAVARADANIAKLMSAAGGPEAFLERYATILTADHGQCAVERDDDVRASFADLRPFLARGRSDPRDCGVAVAASNRAALVYRLASDAPREELALRLAERPSVDVVAWRENGSVCVQREGRRLRFSPGGPREDARGARWTLEGDASALDYAPAGTLGSATYPNALERLWSLLACVNAGEICASARPGWEFCDAGGESHLGGGSHGSLHAADSLVPCTFAGFGAGAEAPAAERSITDLAGAVRTHLGVGRA